MALKPHKTDKVVETREVLSTLDYEKFKPMEGNRTVDKQHVRDLEKLMLMNGNLTYEYPIVVDDDGRVIDGQHRLEALKELGWEVGYVIERNSTIETVRAINRGARNWGWRDVAESFAKLGDENYKWFLDFVDKYGIQYQTAVLLAGGKTTRRRATSGFQAGEFVVSKTKRAEAERIATLIASLTESLGLTNQNFQRALSRALLYPGVDANRMEQKLHSQAADKLPDLATANDYIRVLEDIYNYGYAEDARQRLF